MEYRLDKKIDSQTKDFIASSIERSYKVDRLEISDDKISVSFAEVVSREAFTKLVKDLLYITKNLTIDKVFENKPGHSYDKNPMKPLEESRDVVKIADGLYMFQGMYWKLFQAFHGYVKDMAARFNAVEQEYPTLWPIDLFKKINYFKEFPQQVILTSTVKDTFEARNSFAEKYAMDEGYERVDLGNHADESRSGLQPAVCDTCYYAMSNTTQPENKFYTTYNKVFRNESSKTDSLDRLTNFSVRDIMFVGDKHFVMMSRQRLIDEVIEFLKLLNLDAKIETANDPFFCNESAIKNVFQSSAKLKYEILARINYSDTYIAVGSINLHLDFFGRAFNIRLSDDTYAFSGCLGIGFERLTFAFFCQYGPDVSLWPQDVRERWGVS